MASEEVNTQSFWKLFGYLFHSHKNAIIMLKTKRQVSLIFGTNSFRGNFIFTCSSVPFIICWAEAAAKGKKKGQALPPVTRKVANKDELDGPVNEELKALEAHMLSVTKAGGCMLTSLIIAIVRADFMWEK